LTAPDHTSGMGEYKYVGNRIPRPDGVDKVTGRAIFGSDFQPPGTIFGKVLRSPHAHAYIKSVDLSKALALEGVLAAVSGADFPTIPKDFDIPGIVLSVDLEAFSRQVIARDKALYFGHAIAAVAATSEKLAERALSLIEVEYEVLPHVMTLDEALDADAPVIEEGIQDPSSGIHPNISTYDILQSGDIDAGFKEADLVVERTFTTPSVHYGYIEPNSCVCDAGHEGKVNIWCATQGAFAVQAYVSYIVGLDLSDISVTSSEIGGGFGGKLYAFSEPLATLLSIKSRRPVKITLSREEVFCGTGHAPATRVRIKAGATKTGKITALEGYMEFEGGAFTGGSMLEGRANMASPYNIPNISLTGLDVLVNKPNALAYRAPGAPPSVLASESVISELADGLGIDQIDFRLMNIHHEGGTTVNGVELGPIGFETCLKEAKASSHYSAALSENSGRGFAFAVYHGGGCYSSATLKVKEDGNIVLSVGTPDIGGSRASMVLMAAEVLGISPRKISAQIPGTEVIGFSDVTGGSRTTFATGKAVEEASRLLVEDLCEQAAIAWEVTSDKVYWLDGCAHCDDKNATMRLQDIARKAHNTGGTLWVSLSIDTGFQGPSCSAVITDVFLDRETGKADVERVTAIQDVGKAIHPDYVEGQMQGGAAQALGWALNEEYYWDERGRVLNPGFLDYRIPVAPDLPMIDTIIVEVPDPNHPFGVRGAGEMPMCAPMASVTIALNSMLQNPVCNLPLSPSRVMSAIMCD